MIAVPAGLIFALCVLINGIVLISLCVRPRKESYSIMPVFGPVAGLVFFFTVPIAGANRYWWVAFVADPLSVMFLVFFIGLNLKNLVSPRDD
jgi:uncharacterized membrane protein HdeD (DUF308 family)